MAEKTPKKTWFCIFKVPLKANGPVKGAQPACRALGGAVMCPSLGSGQIFTSFHAAQSLLFLLG